jgi:hypothetical protein
MNAKVFINYRREDAAPYAGRLYDRLTAQFGEDQIFIDIDQIEPGEDFVEVINRKVGTCDIAIVAIGPHWVGATDSSGNRRLDDEEDFVRMEIVAALQRKIRVIPVLVGGARMPRKQELPEALAPLSRRHAIEISETRFHADVNRLIEAIEKPFAVVEERELSATSAAPSPKPAAVRPPEPESKDLAEPSESTKRAEPRGPAVKSSIRESAPRSRRRMPLVVGALGLLAGATLLVSVIVLKNQVQTGQKSGELPSSKNQVQTGQKSGELPSWSKLDEKSSAIKKSGSFETVLADHRWEVRSPVLACQGLIAVFHDGGTFEGMLRNPQDDVLIRPQRVSGKWHVASPLLVLSYNYTGNLSGPAEAQFTIQITEVSERSLSGVDYVVRDLTVVGIPKEFKKATELNQDKRLWEFERLD